MILAIDPGPTPGVASWEPSDHPFHATIMDSPAALEDYLYSMAPGVEAVAIEDFIIQAGGRARTTADSKTTLELIGSVAYLCRHFGIPLHRQLPSDAASFSTNEKLRAARFVTPARPDHARSAARHLFLYLVRSGAIDPLDVIRSLQHEGGGEECR